MKVNILSCVESSIFPDLNFTYVASFTTAGDKITRASKKFMVFNAPYFEHKHGNSSPSRFFISFTFGRS